MIRQFALLVAAFATPAVAGAPSTGDRAALQELADAADQAWNARDSVAMLGMYSDNPSLRVGSEAGELVGRQAIGEYFATAFARRQGEFRHVTDLADVEMLDHHSALSEGTVRVEQRSADGRWTLARRFRTISLAVRLKTGWRLRWVRAIPLS